MEHQALFLLRAISRAISLSLSGDGGLSASGGYSMYDLCKTITIKYDLEYKYEIVVKDNFKIAFMLMNEFKAIKTRQLILGDIYSISK